MYRNQYDSDITTWSPQGRLHQVEYALEAVRQGSAAIGLKSKDYAILLSLKRRSNPLGSFQRKVFKIDDHMGIAIAGLTSDARSISEYMRRSCMNSKHVYEREMPVERLVSDVALRAQKNTQFYGGRPYGVGLLVIGYDESGSHLFEACPSGNYYDYQSMAIGARSQSGKTYLEKVNDKLIDCELKELVLHGLRALRDTLPQDTELDKFNTTLAVVGKGEPLRLIEEDQLVPYIDLLEGQVTRSFAPPTDPTASSD